MTGSQRLYAVFSLFYIHTSSSFSMGEFNLVVQINFLQVAGYVSDGDRMEGLLVMEMVEGQPGHTYNIGTMLACTCDKGLLKGVVI